MALTDTDIVRLLKTGEIKVSPRLKENQINSGSIDLTLGREFWVFKKKYLNGQTVDLRLTSFVQATQKKIAGSITLKPGEMCLGVTREKITLTPGLMGRLEGRSRYARMGLAVHVTSALVQPGSDNRQVLEIVNLAPFPIRIHAGMRISQIVLERCESPSRKPYAKHGLIARHQ